jgi:uncharacterized membrane protein
MSSSPAEAVAGVLPGKKPMISVFMPCTPNPTTGFYFYIPADDVIELPISADDAAKLIMSAGLIQPQSLAALAAMAEATKLERPQLETHASGG